MKMTASFPLTIAADGAVSLAGFDGGSAFMEKLAEFVAANSSGGNPMKSGVEIRITVEPVRTRGRHAKWATMTESEAGQIES